MIHAPSLSASPNIRHAFFTREGGVSDGIYASLNGGIGSNDAPERCARTAPGWRKRSSGRSRRATARGPHAAAISAGMSPPRRKRSSSGSKSGTSAGASRAARLQRREVGVPDARALLLEPQAHDVLEQPDRAVDAALVGQLRGSEKTGPASSRPSSDHVPDERTAAVLVAQRGGDVGRGRVVRGDGVDGRVELVVRERRPSCVPGLDQRRRTARAGSPSRSISSQRPLARARVQQPGRRRVRALVGQLAAQPVGEQVGHERDRGRASRRRGRRPAAGRRC